MTWIKDLFTGGVDKIVDSVGQAANNLFTSEVTYGV
jgi:hypothetical protein